MAEKIIVSWEMDNKQAIKAMRMMRGEMGEKIPKSAKKADKALKQLTSRIASVFSVAMIARGARDIIRVFANYQTAATNVQNITGLTANEMELLGRQVRLLPPSLGTATELMRGLYQAISAGVPHDNAVAFLAENAKAAKGNLADLTITVDASTSVLAAYGLQTSETTAVLDAMTKTVDLGKLTFADLASNIGKGIAIAASAGVEYQELMATMAALTLGGQSVEEAMTGIRNILAMTLKMEPGEGMKKFGVEMSVAAIEAQGFAGYMGSLAEAVQDNVVAQAAMFPNMRAMQAAMDLVSEEGGKRLNFILGEIQGSAGKVGENFERMSKTITAKMAEMGAVAERAKIEIGEAFSNIFTEATGVVDIATAALTRFSVGLVAIRRFAAQVNLEITTSAIEKLKKEFNHYLELVRKGGPLQEHWRKKLRETGAQLVLVEQSQKKANKAWDQTDEVLNAMLDQITGVTGATGKLNDELKETPAVVDDVVGAFYGAIGGGLGLVEALYESENRFRGLGKETNTLANAIGAALVPATLEGADYLQELGEEAKKLKGPVQRMAKTVEQAADIMQTTFSDLLGRGFIGELETFADLWDALWQDLAKSMTGILGDALEEAFKDGGTIEGVLMRGWDNFKTSIEENRLGAGIAGAGMMYAGYEQGGTGGLIQGMMGGAMAGMSVGGPIGAAVGAAVGGLMALFGGDDAPRSRFSVGPTGGRLTTEGQDMGGRAGHDLWVQGRVQEYRASIMAMNDVLRLFGDEGLFDLIRDAPEIAFSGGTADQLATIFRDRWLPNAMRQMFRSAINQGLGAFDVDADTRAQLWSEINALTGENRIAGLEMFIGALVGVSNLYDDMNWQAITDESRQDSLTAFLSGMGEALDAVQMQMLGLDQMTLLERAGQAQTIEQLILQARSAEIQMLRQIDQLQDSIGRSIDSQIEGLRTGGMTDAQLQDYYGGMIDSLMAQLRGGVESPEAIQQIMADLQRYIGLYSGSLGDQLYTQTGFGGSYADELIAILEEARGLSTDALEAMRDQIRESNDALIFELQRLIDALTHYGDTIATADAPPPAIDISGNIDIHVRPSEWFETWVDARIDAAGGAAGREAGPN